MTERAHEFKIGAFVLFGVALILAGLVAFAFSRDVEAVYHFETYVDGDVDGLSVGSAVKLRGVDVGQVTSIRFSWIDYPPGNPRCVVIRFTIAKSQSPIPVGGDEGGKLQETVAEGLRAVVQGQGITGTSVLALKYADPKQYPPLEFSWTPKSLYIPSAPSEFSQIITAVTRVMSNLDKVNFEAIAASVQTKLDDINTKALSEELQHTVSEARKAIIDIRTEVDNMKLADVGKNANGLILGLRSTNDRLERTAGRLSNVDFRNLNDTLAGTREAVDQLNDVLAELKRYPAGFLFGEPPAPATAVSKEKK
jgi:ABC-type transporter Mla subunit MlaD